MKALLAKLNLQDINPGACYGIEGWLSDPKGKELVSYNPMTGEKIVSVIQATPDTFEQVMICDFVVGLSLHSTGGGHMKVKS